MFCFFKLALLAVTAAILLAVSHGGHLSYCRPTRQTCVDSPFDVSSLPARFRTEFGPGEWCPQYTCTPFQVVKQCKATGQCTSVQSTMMRYVCTLRGKTVPLSARKACRFLGDFYCGIGAIKICQCSEVLTSETSYILDSAGRQC